MCLVSHSHSTGRRASRVAPVPARVRADVIDLVAPGTPPLGQPPGLTPARASLPRGLTPDPGAAHGGEDGPHPPTWGRLTGGRARTSVDSLHAYSMYNLDSKDTYFQPPLDAVFAPRFRIRPQKWVVLPLKWVVLPQFCPCPGRLTPHPGAAHASSALPTPGPHARPWGGSRRPGLSPPWGSQ